MMMLPMFGVMLAVMAYAGFFAACFYLALRLVRAYERRPVVSAAANGDLQYVRDRLLRVEQSLDALREQVARLTK